MGLCGSDDPVRVNCFIHPLVCFFCSLHFMTSRSFVGLEEMMYWTLLGYTLWAS